ncbi:MAG: signal recognition particle-docking protein FtsY [Nanoarchaeota archaeon]|nr:signal recognition particle-docking protein FtsY [Nanoarchaeota archaeon]
MFDFLKKKIQGWIANKPEKVEKKPKKKAKTESKSIKEKPKSVKSQKSQTYSEKKLEKEVDQLITESETPIQTEKIEKSQETEKESGNFFTKLLKKITTSKLSQTDFDEAFEDLEITLLENNVALEAVDAIRASLSQSLVEQQIKKTEAPARILAALKDAILSLLQEPPSIIKQIKEKKDGPFVILFFGINGTGKTTSIAKLAHYLKEEKISCVLAAADTFRAASIEQLQTHANKLKVPIVSSQYGSDPSSVAFDAISYAKSHKIQCVLIDTAGRMYTKSNLLKEMEKIIRVSKPDLKIFVGESITGNDAIEQARTFNETAGIDGIILSKADIDKKAGTILSVSHITKKPIYFLGTGQDYKDLTPFTKKTVLKNLGLE